MLINSPNRYTLHKIVPSSVASVLKLTPFLFPMLLQLRPIYD